MKIPLPKVFKPVPEDLDFIFYVHFCLIFFIVSMMMFFSDGESTIKYIDSLSPTYQSYNVNLSVSPLSSQSIELVHSYNLGQVMKYKTALVKQNFRIPYIVLFVYWILIPLVNFLYFLWWFPKRKSLNSSNPVIVVGEVK